MGLTAHLSMTLPRVLIPLVITLLRAVLFVRGRARAPEYGATKG